MPTAGGPRGVGVGTREALAEQTELGVSGGDLAYVFQGKALSCAPANLRTRDSRKPGRSCQVTKSPSAASLNPAG